jgi:hypothetical protein
MVCSAISSATRPCRALAQLSCSAAQPLLEYDPGTSRRRKALGDDGDLVRPGAPAAAGLPGRRAARAAGALAALWRSKSAGVPGHLPPRGRERVGAVEAIASSISRPPTPSLAASGDRRRWSRRCGSRRTRPRSSRASFLVAAAEAALTPHAVLTGAGAACGGDAARAARSTCNFSPLTTRSSLAVVIGRPGRHIPVERALEHRPRPHDRERRHGRDRQAVPHPKAAGSTRSARQN